MLRKNFKPQSKKVLDVPPLVDSVTSEVIVSVTDPVTGEVSERKEFVTKCVAQSPVDASELTVNTLGVLQVIYACSTNAVTGGTSHRTGT